MYKKILRVALKTVGGFLICISVFYYLLKDDKVIEKKIEQVKPARLKPWYFEGGSLRPRPGDKRPKLWPEEETGDRIINQLMFIPEKEPRSKKKIYLPKSQTLKFEGGSKIFHDLNCPVKSCEIVFDETVADAVVFEDVLTTVRKKSFHRQIWIFHSLESPLVFGKAMKKIPVTWTASYRTDSDLVTPYDKWVYYDENEKKTTLRKNFAAGKTKKVAWLVSNCHSKNKRLEYGKVLRKHIAVDIYGACGDKVCLGRLGRFCQDFISKNYKFYLSFENANCRDYITEKFYANALRLDVIPIVMGAPKEDYEKVAPLNSFIHVEDFPSPKHLADYLHHLDKNDAHYNSYFLWKDAGEFIDTHFVCRLCAVLHAERKNQFYEKMNRWWKKPGICTKTFWNNATKDHIMKSLRLPNRLTPPVTSKL